MAILQWLKNKFKRRVPEPNPYTGMFKGWQITRNFIVSPNHEYTLYKGESFSSFSDSPTSKHLLLYGTNRRQRQLLWEELQREIKVRATRNLERLTNEANKNEGSRNI